LIETITSSRVCIALGVINIRKDSFDQIFDIRGVEGVTRFGIVRKCEICRQPGKKVLVKTLHLLKLRKYAKEVIEELMLLKYLKHPQIHPISKIYRDGEKLYIMRHVVEGVNLKHFMKRENRLSESQVADIITQIIKIVKYIKIDYFVKKRKNSSLSTQDVIDQVIHRDIKIENFIVDPETLHVKLLDYGISSTFLTLDDLKSHMNVPVSYAPECLKDSFTSNCETWSIGIITYQLLTSRTPYTGKSKTELFHNIINYESKLSTDHWPYSERAKKFIQNMLGDQVPPVAAIRMSLSMALKHEFLLSTMPVIEAHSQEESGSL